MSYDSNKKKKKYELLTCNNQSTISYLFVCVPAITGCLYKELRCCCVETTEVTETTQQTQPPAKKQKVSLFGRYKVTATQSTSSQDQTPGQVLTSYLELIGVTDMKLSDAFSMDQFSSIRPLLERVLCVPASSAPVERIFSQSGLVMKPNRARMSDTLLEELVFLKCNDC